MAAAGPPGSCCSECGSLNTSEEWRRAFGVRLCSQCRRDFPLISKATAKSTYLLSDGDLSQLGSLPKSNPQHPDWRPMKMFLASQVERVAVAKHGSLEDVAGVRQQRLAGRLQQRAAKRQREQRREEEEAAALQRLTAAAARGQAAAAAGPSQPQEQIEEVVDQRTGRLQRRYGADAALVEVEEL